MVTVNIDETTEVGKRILRELSENPDTAQVKFAKIPRDENGNPIGTPWEEVRDELEQELSEHYGVDFRKVREMKDIGMLDIDELTDEILLSSEFKYESYPEFKPKNILELSENSDIEQAKDFEIPLDENGVPIGTPWKEVRERLERQLSESSGIDFRKVREMEEAGMLDMDELTDEILLSPEFQYEPFKPKNILELSENPDIEQAKDFEIPLDENGVPIGTPWEEVRERMYDDLSEHYGVDLRTL